MPDVKTAVSALITNLRPVANGSGTLIALYAMVVVDYSGTSITREIDLWVSLTGAQQAALQTTFNRLNALITGQFIT